MTTFFLKTSRNKVKRNTADQWFSRFIRIRDIITGEYCRCVTCGKSIHWKYEAQCGHYATRGKAATRYNEQNCHAQCVYCNGQNKGEQAKHGFKIDDMYGEGTARSLIELSGTLTKHSKMAISDIAKEYREKTKKIAKKKGIEL